MGTFLRRRRTIALAALALVLTVLWTGAEASGSNHDDSTLVACLHSHEFKYFVRPVNCDFFARQYYPDGRLRRYRDIGGRHLRWAHWGGPVAIGVGKSDLAVPFTVKAFDRVRCNDGRWYYGKVFTHASVGPDQHLRLARCGARRFAPFRQQVDH